MPKEKESVGIYLGWKSVLSIVGPLMAALVYLVVYIHGNDVKVIERNTTAIEGNTLIIGQFNDIVSQLRSDLSRMDGMMLEKMEGIGRRVELLEDKQ